MEQTEKDFIKLKLGLCLRKIIEENKVNAAANHKAVDSLRKLEAASGVSFSIIQKITAGNKNPEFTTIVALAEGLDMTVSELINYYDSISDKEIKAYRENLKKAKQDKQPKEVKKKK